MSVFVKKKLFRCFFLVLLLMHLRFPQELQSERPHVGLVFPNRAHMGLACLNLHLSPFAGTRRTYILSLKF